MFKRKSCEASITASELISLPVTHDEDKQRIFIRNNLQPASVRTNSSTIQQLSKYVQINIFLHWFIKSSTYRCSFTIRQNIMMLFHVSVNHRNIDVFLFFL